MSESQISDSDQSTKLMKMTNLEEPTQQQDLNQQTQSQSAANSNSQQNTPNQQRYQPNKKTNTQSGSKKILSMGLRNRKVLNNPQRNSGQLQNANTNEQVAVIQNKHQTNIETQNNITMNIQFQENRNSSDPQNTISNLRVFRLGTSTSSGQQSAQSSKPNSSNSSQNLERTNKAIKDTKKEIVSSCDKIISFFINTVIIKCIRLALYFGYACIYICAIPLNFLSLLGDILFGRSRLITKTSAKSQQDKNQNGCFKCRSKSNQEQAQYEREQKRRLQSFIESETCCANCQNNNQNSCQQKHGIQKSSTRRLQVVLDLDNTLIHSINTQPSTNESNYFPIKNNIFVFKRPHMEYFLNELFKIADVMVFTASMQDYADQILDVIDPQNKFIKRFYRHVSIKKFPIFLGLQER
ncbi:dullard-like phosphatase domain containing protein [Stylonychia lemnae]|uniref:Mitochondrial import inner membrane translocase subunit TIM50 n=1 Tax=Stylonychia lemnae TaxID=5949 RepID=A0A077ZY76_STYLE|nr:dullard-like phosphatase domain containing protein [Stylonychia lemnae]|eukprot:CDW74592.1 dullard-like phosphatase domain containing protein [Stylonychia lemnae]